MRDIESTLVLYHANCPDGMTAAWAIWKRYGSNAVYMPVNYGSQPPDIKGYDNVIVVDFSYPREVMVEMAKLTNLTVLDHHKTAEENLRGLPFATFDMGKSGGRLAWEWVFPNAPTPRLIKYTEDRDLWRWGLKKSREISQWLRMFPMTFDEWDKAYKTLENDGMFWAASKQGEALLSFQMVQVDIMARRAERREVGEYVVPVVNATCFFSEVGEKMCELYPTSPFSAYYFDRRDGIRQWGLRSRTDFDCSIVAKELGGGGHPGAAGFTTTTDFQFKLHT